MFNTFEEMAEYLLTVAWELTDEKTAADLTYIAQQLQEYRIRISIEIHSDNHPAVEIGTYPTISTPIAYTTLDWDRNNFDHELEPSLVEGDAIRINEMEEILLDVYTEALPTEEDDEEEDDV